MKIRTKFQLNTLVSIILIVAIGATLLISYQQFNAAMEKDRLVAQMERGIFELNIATYDYLLTRGERAFTQWQQRFQSLGALIRSEKFHSPEEKRLMDEIEVDRDTLGTIFSSFSEGQASGRETSPELQNRLLGHLLIKSHAMISVCEELHRICHGALVAVQRRAGLMVMLSIFIVGVIIAVNSVLMGLSILKPIWKLGEDARIVGQGNLDTPVASEKMDEIGDLSRAFDQMAKSLKTVMTSREILEEEIRQRMKLEAELRESEESLRTVLDATPFPIALVDEQDKNIHFWNRNALTTFGHAAPTVEEWNQIAYPDPAYRREVIERWRPFVEKARVSAQAVNAGEYRVTCSNGSVRICEIYPAFRRGKLVVTFHDVTERKRAEEERKQMEQRLRQAESLGRMAGAVAHHFNNMLGVALGNLELAVDGLPQESEARANIFEAAQASRRAAELSRLMLTYLGQATVKKAPLDLSEAIQEAIPLIAASLPQKVRMKTELPTKGPIVPADGAYIEQVLTNLVTNAIEALDGGEGEITLAINTVSKAEMQGLRCYPLDWEPKAASYARSVADNGSGMDAETLERVFDPFFMTKFTGRGLGLAVVLGLVRAHDGAITVESSLGHGSVFRLFYPLHAQQPPTL